ncbi:unnamed protein product [Arctia plantaginis]|uniref:UV radiation resistance-associated gene protein n=1 Tax=Arctia plantaginis TaxID=874455 RepID=A0A8S1BDW0_ARCPL|nr:unnamed protein product [Arctia plantaginis]
MFGRPRCREWTPLATQQLRLRSLIQVVGYNIRPPEWCTLPCSFYITLHHTTMSAPFYTSERISSPHPKWKEIDSETTHRVSSANVVIRIWCHVLHSSDETTKQLQDTIIQTWGVYFSGLRYIGANLASNFTSDCFKSNTLVFQMHGGYFCSYKSLKLDVIPPENEIEHGSLSSDSSGRTNLSKITLEPKHILNHKLVKESRSISPSKYTKKFEKEYSKSHSPVERGFQQYFPTLKTSNSLNISQSQRGYRRREENTEESKSDPNYIYEHSPENLDVKEFAGGIFSQNTSQEDLSSKIDLSETAESYDLRSEADGVPKYRYMALSFLKSEIRPSYNATKLQQLHLLQYSIKKRQEAVQEIKERIYNKSALTNEDLNQHDDLCDVRLKFKSRSQRNLFSPDDDSLSKDKSTSQVDLRAKNGKIKEDKPIVSNGSRLTFSKLNDLLSYKSKPSPFQRAEHVRLTKQLEILRFKRIILSDERDAKLASIRKLKERRTKLFEENQDVGECTELMQNYHSLSRRSENVKETRQCMIAVRELAANSHHALCAQRCELLTQLHQIFYIDQKDATTWTICGVPLAVCGDENLRSNAISDSVAAGFVAQATCLVATLLNQPLRYKVTLLGSASKILDTTPDLPDPNIPLFPRGGDTTLFRYALFLLNKCIAQLMVGRGLPLSDIRPTLANLQRLLTTPSNMSDTTKLYGTYRWLVDSQCPRTQSLRSLVASERCKYRQFNRFKDSVDGQSLQSALNLRRHRHSRSVGSYHDDQELPTLEDSTTSIMGSESNIYNMKLTQVDSSDLPHSLKSHNSDSEIIRINNPEERQSPSKVMFTLGDNSTIEVNTKLVRTSTNNQDELTTNIDENVKKICSEISDFCSSEIAEGVDIAKHLDLDKNVEEINIVKYMERKLSEEYESNGIEGDSERGHVTDVIVIPSAEAILDTGQDKSRNDEQIQ